MRRLRCRHRRRWRLRLTHAAPARGHFGRPRVLLLAPASSYRISAYADAARSLGIEFLVASEGVHSLIPEVAEGLHVDLRSAAETVNRIVAEGRRKPFAAVIATDDVTVELASLVAEALELPHHPAAAARLARRKDLARDALLAGGVPVPQFRRIDLGAEILAQVDGLPFPCVVKPLALAGSRGVIRVDSPTELLDACRRVKCILADVQSEEERQHVLVEEYVPGTEVAMEGLLTDGKLHTLALFDKPDPLEGPYFEESYYVTPSRLNGDDQALVQSRVEQACAAYGLREGPVHAEVRLGRGDAWIIEMAARTIGGDCARLLKFGTGRGLEEVILSHALGRPLDLDPSPEGAGVLMIPTPRAGVLRRVEGVLAAQKVPCVEDVVIAVREGYELVPLPEGSTYLGFIFARGPTPHQVEQALRRAHARLNVVVAPLWRPERA